MEEIWKTIPDCNNRYFISNFGNIKSIFKMLKPAFNSKGYLGVCLSVNGKKKWVHIHRISALCFLDNPLNKDTVNHKDGNKLNNHISNLEWLTNVENLAHGRKLRQLKSG